MLERMGLSGREFRLPDGTLVERLTTASGGAQAVAVVLAPATDPVQEVGTAQTMAHIRETLETVPGKPSLLVVPIGYRSDSVQRLIKDISWVEPFDGTDFEARLQGALNQMIVVPPPPVGDSSPLLGSVLQRIEELQTELKELRNIRQDRAEVTAVRLAAGTDKLAAPEREKREARTKWELVDGLETVRSALDDENPELERAVLRSLVVANEVNVRNSAFDYLGGLYMDALDLEGSLIRSQRLQARTPTTEAMKAQVRNLRAEIIGLARRSVMQPREFVPNQPLVLALAATGTGLVASSLALLATMRSQFSPVEIATIAAAVGAACGTLGGLWGYRETLRRSPRASYSYISYKIDRLRQNVIAAIPAVEP